MHTAQPRAGSSGGHGAGFAGSAGLRGARPRFRYFLEEAQQSGKNSLADIGPTATATEAPPLQPDVHNVPVSAINGTGTTVPVVSLSPPGPLTVEGHSRLVRFLPT
jgi:hypothetical protein